MCCRHITECYSALKVDEIVSQATVQMGLENRMLSEKAIPKRPHTIGFHLYETSRRGNSKETES